MIDRETDKKVDSRAPWVRERALESEREKERERRERERERER